MSDDIKKQLGAVIDSYKEDLCQMADEIFDLAEISGEEYKTSDILCSYLEKEGFVIERHIQQEFQSPGRHFHYPMLP